MPPGADNELPPIYQSIGALTEAIKGLREDIRELKEAEVRRSKRDMKIENRLSTIETELSGIKASIATMPKSAPGEISYRDMDRKLKITIAGTASGVITLALMLGYALVQLILHKGGI